MRYMEKKQKRFNISFRENVQEIELYEWIRNKSEITPISSTIKEILYKAMQQEKSSK